MKMPALLVTVFVTMTAAALLVAPAIPQDAAVASRKVQQDESARKVKELRKERLAVLRDMAEVMDAMYRKSRVDADRVYDAKQLLLTAEVDLAENDSDRVKLYEKFVGAMKEYEELAAA